MQPKVKSTPRDIFSSIQDDQQFNIDKNLIEKIEKDQNYQLFLNSRPIERFKIQTLSQKISITTKRTRKKNQKCIEENDSKRSSMHYSKTYDKNFFSSSKRMTPVQQNKDIHKTISSSYQFLIEKERNAKIIELASRYGIFKHKNNKGFKEVLKRQSKKSNNFIGIESLNHTRKKSIIPVNSDPGREADPRLTKTTDFANLPCGSYDKNFSLLLDRNKIAKSSNYYDSEKNHLDSSVIDRNRKCVNPNSAKKSKPENKIQMYINENIQLNNDQIKRKLNKKTMIQTYYDQFQIQKDLNRKQTFQKSQKFNQINKEKCEDKGLSKKMYLADGVKSMKHSSFSQIKNSTDRTIQQNYGSTKNQNQQSRQLESSKINKQILLIPGCINFKKKQSSKGKNITENDLRKASKQRQTEVCQDQHCIIIENVRSISPHKQKSLKRLPFQRTRSSKQHRPNTEGNGLQYSRKQFCNSKVGQLNFIFDSKDHTYIPQYLILNGWRQYVFNKLNQSCTLKWVNNPVTSEILTLKQGQFYNHFHKSFELTSKNFLSSNLRANTHFLATHKFFPETYDIGNQTERQEFMRIFRYRTMMSLLQNIILYCIKSQTCSKLVKTEFQKYKQMKQTEEIYQKEEQDARLGNQSFNPIELQNYKAQNEDFRLNIFLVILSLKFYRKERKRHDIDFRQKKSHYLRFNNDEFKTHYESFQIYSKQEDMGHSCDQKGLFSYHYATPSQLLIKMLVRQYCFFSVVNNWIYPVEEGIKNVLNIWIVKPSSNARGNGIYLETSLNAMLKSAKDIQSRIVQKYIQRPLLFKNTRHTFLNNHKFDIRQWVLVKSLDPLQIYMFSHFYLRLASEKYELYPIQNNKVHLTNFTANKQFFKNDQQSIISSDQFVQMLREQYGIEWEKSIKPRVEQIIIKSIQACQQKLESSQNGTCFELLGYDILIDQKFNPWLIEVNMSPACEERTQWLSQYLRNMNQGLLDIVLSPTHLPFYPTKVERKQYWSRIHNENYHFTQKDYDSRLEVVAVNLQTKNKSTRQNDQIKTKANIDGMSSPSKFRSQLSRRKSLNGKKSNQKIKTITQINQLQAKQKTIGSQLDEKEQNKQQIHRIKEIQQSSPPEIQKITEMQRVSEIKSNLENNSIRNQFEIEYLDIDDIESAIGQRNQ